MPQYLQELKKLRQFWFAAIGISVSWAFALATFLLMDADGLYQAGNVYWGLVFLPVTLVCSFFLLYLLGPLFKHTTTINLLKWLAVCLALGAVTLVVFPPLQPAFPVRHYLKITAPGEKDSFSQGKTVQILKISAPDGTAVPISSLQLDGNWLVSGSSLTYSGDTPVSFKLSTIMVGGASLELKKGPSAGIVKVYWDGNEQTVDLFTADKSSQLLDLPGYNWSKLNFPLKAAAALFYGMQGISLAAILFLFYAFLIKRKELFKIEWAPYAVILTASTFLRLNTFIFSKILQVSDSFEYLGIFRLVKNGVVVCCRRPFTTPLVYSLLGRNLTTIVEFQIIFSLASWAFLAFVTAKSIRSRAVRPWAFGFVELFSLSSALNLWDKILLSESISFSLFAVVLALWLLFLRKKNWIIIIALVLTTLLFVFSRATNGYSILFVGVLLAGVMIFKPEVRSRYTLTVIISYAMIFAAGLIGSNMNKELVLPYLNIMAQRILPSVEARDFYQQAGMPLDANVMKLSGQNWGSFNGWAFFTDPALEQFRQWSLAHGIRTYAAYLISHPRILFIEPLEHLDRLLQGWDPQGTQPFVTENYFPPAGSWLNLANQPEEPKALLFFAALILVFTITRWSHKKHFESAWLLPLVLLALVYPQMLLNYHADSKDITRHALATGIQMRFGLWLLLLYALDPGEENNAAECKKEALKSK